MKYLKRTHTLPVILLIMVLSNCTSIKPIDPWFKSLSGKYLVNGTKWSFSGVNPVVVSDITNDTIEIGYHETNKYITYGPSSIPQNYLTIVNGYHVFYKSAGSIKDTLRFPVQFPDSIYTYQINLSAGSRVITILSGRKLSV